MKIVLWRGYHSKELLKLISQCWQNNSLLIVCPPWLSDYPFLKILDLSLNPNSIEFCGDWSAEQKSAAQNASTLQSSAPLSSTSEILPRPPVFPAPPVLGVFTSGTLNGQARLVLYSKLNIESSLKSIRALFQTERIQQIFCYPQPFHTFGLILGYLHAVLYQLELRTPEGKYHREAHALWHESLQANTLTLGAPAHFYDLLAFSESQNLKAAPSYSAIVGGAPVSTELWYKIKNHLHIEAPSIGYGATEAAPGVTHLPPGIAPQEDGEIGVPLDHLKVEILPGRGIQFSGASCCLAIVHADHIEFPGRVLLSDNIELSRTHPKPSNELNGKKRLSYKGRLDWVLNRGGQKISLEAIEALVNSQLSLASIAVDMPDERLGSELGILFQLKPLENASSWQSKISKLLHEKFSANFKSFYFQPISDLPLSPSAKLDRNRAKQILTDRLQRKLHYPVAVATLAQTIPHRAPALWLDEVMWVDAEQGQCRVHLNTQAHYFLSPQKLRASSCIEWMAQAQAFVSACQGEENFKPNAPTLKRAYLVAIRSLKIHQAFYHLDLNQHRSLWVRVQKTHQFGPITLIQGQIQTETGEILAEGQLRLFAD